MERDLNTRMGRRGVIGIAIIVIIALGGGVLWRAQVRQKAVSTTTTPQLSQVTLVTIGHLAASSTFQTIGTVSSVSEAHVQAQAGGQVTSVPVKLGQAVSAGTVIATLDNAVQSAALLQAKGAYDAAVASTKVGELSSNDAAVGVQTALTSANTTYQSAYTTVSGVVYNTLDQFYGDPNALIPGVQLATGPASYFNSERVALQTILPNWQESASAGVTAATVSTSLQNAIDITERVAALTDTFVSATQSARGSDMLNGKTVNSYTASLLTAQATLSSTIAALKGAETTLTNAQSALTKAQLSGSTPGASLTNAQLLQAEGALRSAQANYDKTIIRTPISGTINGLYVRAGDNAAVNTPIALIANNSGLQVDTYVTEADSLHIAIGDVVTINNTATGTVIAEAGALDPATGKIAVQISVTDPQQVLNGSTVQVTFTEHDHTVDQNSNYTIPLTAVKLGVDTANIFTISSSSTLIAHPVTLGEVVGTSVVVTSGLTPDMNIVTDARGLAVGQQVTVNAQ